MCNGHIHSQNQCSTDSSVLQKGGGLLAKLYSLQDPTTFHSCSCYTFQMLQLNTFIYFYLISIATAFLSQNVIYFLISDCSLAIETTALDFSLSSHAIVLFLCQVVFNQYLKLQGKQCTWPQVLTPSCQPFLSLITRGFRLNV